MFKKILLVDGTTEDAELTFNALHHCGIKNPVVYVGDGTQALIRLVEDRDIAIVLLNLHTHVAEGFDLLKQLRFQPQFSLTPVFLVSSFYDEAHRKRAELLGASGYVVKAFEPERFADLLCDALAPFRHLLEEAA
ncbi:MAG: response regulator [Janthinobacterium lividum]